MCIRDSNNAVVATTTITNTSSSISQIEEPVKIKHLYHIGTSRSIYVDEDNDVSIVDDGDNGKRAFFTAQRWVRFVRILLSLFRSIFDRQCNKK